MNAPEEQSRQGTDQVNVQRQLGRCLLRLQQLERLLKHLNAHSELSGTVDTLESNRDAKVREIASQTLGQLVRAFTSSSLTLAGEADAQSVDEPTPAKLDGKVWMRFRYSVELSAENYARVVQDLLELRDLRNELVHHLIERFNLWVPGGCDKAAVYLDDAYERIDQQYRQVAQWATNANETRRLSASFTASAEFGNVFVNGIAPDGTVIAWSFTPIVEYLDACSVLETADGWRRLEDAIAQIRRDHPDETPSRYQCSSWRHLLHESQLFEVRKEKPTATGATVVWYRRKPAR